MSPKLSNSEKFVGTLYPRKFEFDKTSYVDYFRKEFEWTCSLIRFLNFLPLLGQKNQDW